MKYMRIIIIISVLLFPISYFLNPVIALAVTCTNDIDGKTDSELEAILEACDKEIEIQSVGLANTQRTATSLEAGIAELDYKISTAQLEIRRRNVAIARLGDDIGAREQRLDQLGQRGSRIKSSLGELVRKSNELESFSVVEAVLSTERLSDFFVDLDDFGVVKAELQGRLVEIREIRAETEEEKLALQEKHEEERQIRYQKEKEKQQEELFKNEKQRVLTATRGQETAYKELIAEKERIKNEIRNRIFKTVGGTEITFAEALRLVRTYEDKIGVNPALILAVLTQESSVNGTIGANIGQCTYNQPYSNSSGTVMSNTQKPAFLALTAELGIDPNTTPVSCPIPQDGAHGGAMGAAQFMPGTWWNPSTETGYKKRVAKVTGDPNPSPFNNLHAFTGTALYLSDALDRCLTAFSTTMELRQCTAAKYYSGISSRGDRLARHMYPQWSYGNQVALRAAKFEKDIAILDS